MLLTAAEEKSRQKHVSTNGVPLLGSQPVLDAYDAALKDDSGFDADDPKISQDPRDNGVYCVISYRCSFVSIYHPLSNNLYVNFQHYIYFLNGLVVTLALALNLMATGHRVSK